MKKITFSILHLFSGLGGAALGFQQAAERFWDLEGSFYTLAGIDCDPEACADFEALTGAPAVRLDLFSREDYIAYHGQEPPDDWRESGPEDIRKACGGIVPDVIFSSPPCKGFSGLLPKAAAQSAKYQALNNLTVRGLWLVLEAFRNDLPGIIMLENVPRITSRGKTLLHTIKGLLQSYGYAVNDGFHCCGEIGGLGQKRRRYLLIARNPEKVPAFVYQPPKKKLKTIGDIIGPMPLPDDESAGPMHRLPRLQWKTWVRIALIPAGGDWRDLEDLNYSPRGGAFKIVPWEEPGTAVIASARTGGSNGMAAIADPRIDNVQGYGNKYKVVKWDEPCFTVTGSRLGSGAPAVSDPRKPPQFNHIYRVTPWNETAGVVTGAGKPSSGALTVADPRLRCSPRAGMYGVQDWNEPANTVTGARNLHSGTAAVADPRIPAETDRPDTPPVIISLDGTWHRPLTTLELAALQGFPLYMPNGSPLKLAGGSHARWRERIGNAVPVGAAKAIGETILRALLPAAKGMFLTYQVSEKVWVSNLKHYAEQ